ncbi:DUF2911 domain-containing protein [Flammeovirga sp. SJP92]|uniref:DUF2911 domain-containing protein n=1 Tax=Flammeovirga sp. SJP92 TaxID=1775430 RepID=UPI000788C585|nr:DUF2911 domain-containing protein [Flammeovirga sp. SJP92]KXX71545.1 hypothetical protein AVL50_04545 [Flammeovirga sp. SJP92]
MRKIFVIVLGVLLGLGILGYFGQKMMISETKKHSPEMEQNFVDGDTKIDIHYSSPYKKGRVIFGNLVPYGQVWRTGANEPTTFKTNVPLNINGKNLPAGKYTLWTIPESKTWTIIFNDKHYNWGVSFGGKASRDENFDKVVIETDVIYSDKTMESLRIWIEKGDKSDEYNLKLGWDQTLIEVDVDKA